MKKYEICKTNEVILTELRNLMCGVINICISIVLIPLFKDTLIALNLSQFGLKFEIEYSIFFTCSADSEDTSR